MRRHLCVLQGRGAQSRGFGGSSLRRGRQRTKGGVPARRDGDAEHDLPPPSPASASRFLGGGGGSRARRGTAHPAALPPRASAPLSAWSLHVLPRGDLLRGQARPGTTGLGHRHRPGRAHCSPLSFQEGGMGEKSRSLLPFPAPLHALFLTQNRKMTSV